MSDHICKHLDTLPPVVSESQMNVQCPNCGFYYKGHCENPNRQAATDPCPFDGKPLPLKEVTEEN